MNTKNVSNYILLADGYSPGQGAKALSKFVLVNNWMKQSKRAKNLRCDVL